MNINSSNNDYFSELEKIANEILLPEDVEGEAMVPDTAPHVDPDTVEVIQTVNSAATPDGAEEQQPTNPEDQKALAEALESARSDYEAAKETLAALTDEWNVFEKTANEITELLPSMGALARLVDYSTNSSISDDIQKLASERLVIALTNDDGFAEMIQKTAEELFADEENVQQLHSDEGMHYVVEQLASFSESEELEKVAFDMGGIANSVREGVGEYVNATRNFWKLKDQIDAAKSAVDETRDIVIQKEQVLNEAKKLGPAAVTDEVLNDYANANYANLDARDTHDNLIDQRNKGAQVWGAGGAGLAGGAFLGGKAIYNATRPNNPEDELSVKTASVTINPEEIANIKGGTKMSIVKDFLKVAGAAGLLDIANDENQNIELRKEAAATFNAISRMNRSDMEESFEKMATTIFSEPQLHEIVAGQHNEALFNKIAYFTDLADVDADTLEKVAGADSVAAKGVAGALTDAKANIEEKVKADKEHAETAKNGELGTRKMDDMRGYNVINNPGAYKVEKTAALNTMIEEAEMRKEAAYRIFVEADTFIKNNQ